MWTHIHEFIHDFTIFFIDMNSNVNMNSFTEFSYDFMYKILWICVCIHMNEFCAMISLYFFYTWIHTWIQDVNSYINPCSWIQMVHFMTYEFRYEFMFMKNIVKWWSHMKSGGTELPDHWLAGLNCQWLSPSQPVRGMWWLSQILGSRQC